MHLPHLIQSGFGPFVWTSSCIGQTFSHLLQLMHFDSSVWSWYFLPPMRFCTVPIGQNVHQVRGLNVVPATSAIEVVTRHMMTINHAYLVNKSVGVKESVSHKSHHKHEDGYSDPVTSEYFRYFLSLCYFPDPESH